MSENNNENNNNTNANTNNTTSNNNLNHNILDLRGSTEAVENNHITPGVRNCYMRECVSLMNFLYCYDGGSKRYLLKNVDGLTAERDKDEALFAQNVLEYEEEVERRRIEDAEDAAIGRRRKRRRKKLKYPTEKFV